MAARRACPRQEEAPPHPCAGEQQGRKHMHSSELTHTHQDKQSTLSQLCSMCQMRVQQSA
jgi:hypothetical protein